jgi:Rrf2 family iron-sulfur cluster assembly transcriptional regulator
MLTRAADYAVRVMVHLATLPAGTRVQRTTLAEFTDVPESFISKVLQGLVRARMISSKPGHNGGFELASPPESITLLDVVEAIDGPVALNLCVGAAPGCERHLGCAAHPVWMEAQQAVTRVLRSATIARLAAQASAPGSPPSAAGVALDGAL